MGKRDTEFNVEKPPQCGGEKTHEKTDLLCGMMYRVQGGLFI
jgi:hypothetical protein